METYTGHCHCGAVEFTAKADLEHTSVCNCSHCQMKGLIMAFIPKEDFTLIKGKDNLTIYHFNKKAIDHKFCKVCGVEPFSTSENWPKMMINVRCLDGVDIDSLTPEKVNGKDY